MYLGEIWIKMGQLRPHFWFIFVRFKHKFYRKTVDVSGIQTRIVGIEGKHADHLTPNTADLGEIWLMASSMTRYFNSIK